MSMSDIIGEAREHIVVLNMPYATFTIRHIFVKLNLLLFNQLNKNIMAYYAIKKYQVVVQYLITFQSNIN